MGTIVLPRPSTTTTTYPHIVSLFPACKKKSFWEPSEQHHSKNRMHRQSGASERRFLLRVYNHRESTRRCVVDTIVLPRPSTTTTTYPHSIIIFLSAWFHHQTTHNIYICVYSKCHRLCTVHDGTWKQSFLYDWMQLLSLECLIAIYCEGQPSLGGLASSGLGFVHNVMGINLCTTQWPWGGGQTFPRSAWPVLNSMVKVTIPC